MRDCPPAHLIIEFWAICRRCLGDAKRRPRRRQRLRNNRGSRTEQNVALRRKMILLEPSVIYRGGATRWRASFSVAIRVSRRVWSAWQVILTKERKKESLRGSWKSVS